MELERQGPDFVLDPAKDHARLPAEGSALVDYVLNPPTGSRALCPRGLGEQRATALRALIASAFGP